MPTKKAEAVDFITNLQEDSFHLDSSDSEIEELSHGHASAEAIEAGTFASKRYLSNSEHGHSVVSESGDLEWNVNIISSDEQQCECLDEI